MIPIQSSPSSQSSSASSVISSASTSSSTHLSTTNSTQSTNSHNLFSLTQYQQQQLLLNTNSNNRNYFDNLLYSELIAPENMNEFSDLKTKIETLIKLNSKSFNNRSTFSLTPQSSTSTCSDIPSCKSPPLNSSKTATSPQNSNILPSTTLRSILASFDSTPSSSTTYDENFISSLFNLFISYDFKDKSKNDSFIRLYNDLKQTHMIRNPFLVIAKLGHECFKLDMLDISECLLELAINNIDTSSLRLKMATLSTLSACYWKQAKFTQSINCMNLELDMASHLNKDSNYNNLYLGNIYRIYGNLASAYQRLNNLDECLKNFQHQLIISEQINETILIINTTNSIGIVYNKQKQYTKALEYFEKSFYLIENYSQKLEKLVLKKLELKQNNLLGDCCLKLNLYERARVYFLNQLDLSSQLMYEHQNLKLKSETNTKSKNEVPIDDLDQHWFQECQATYNLALLNTKLKNYFESVDYFEKCLCKIQLKTNSSQQVLELHGRVYLGLINNCLNLKDNLKAALHAHSMLDFTLKELNKLNDETDKRRLKYLKFLEMSACSKLASCYWKQNRVDDALKLYQREADLAKQMNNTFYLTRSYSHIAQCYFHFKEYDKTISLYKQILNLIEISLMKKRTDQQEEIELDETTGKQVYLAKDDRLVQMIYFTLSNIGLCMEMQNKLDDAYLMYEEQFEISKLIRNLKFKANALLNLINLNLNKMKYDQEDKERHKNLIEMLKELFMIYTQLNDLNGKLFTSQSLAYCYHTSGNLSQAIEHYSHNIELSKSNLTQFTNDMLKKSMFNLSLCYKMNNDLNRALKHQLEYLELISQSNEQNNYLRFKSLGIVSDLMFEIDKSEENCKHCIELNVERLKIVKNLPNECLVSNSILKDLIDLENVQNSEKNPTNSSETSEPKLKLINQCLDAISKYYYHLENYQQVLKFKLIQLEIKKELETQLTDRLELVELEKEKSKLWFEMGNLFLFKFEDTNESYTYFQMTLEVAIQHKDLVLESLTLGNMGLCRQKSGDYEDAMEHFKTQLTVLAKRLHLTNFESKKPIVVTNENLNEIKELVSIRIDMARSYSQLSKCAELLSLQTKQTTYYVNESEQYLLESFNYLNEYFKECEYLYENYSKYFLEMIETNLENSKKENEEKNNKFELNTIKELSEHIFIDYDHSMAKLSYFLAAYENVNDEDYDPDENMERAIELTVRRLRLYDYCSKLVLNATYWINLNIQINFTLATFYSKDPHSLNKSKQICESILEIFSEEHMELDSKTNQMIPVLKDQIYLIETNNLICDISMIEYGNSNYNSVLDKALDSYYLIWDYNEVKNDNNYNRLKNQNILKLKYDSICRVSYLYKKLKMRKECVEILMDAVQRLTVEFQNLQHLTHSEHKKLSNVESNYSLNPKDYFLTQYMEYLFLIHRKIALIHLNHAIESNFKHQDLLLLSLKHVNESLTYLNYHKEFQSDSFTIRLRETSIYYLFGKCHRYLNSNEMSLEMFASALDLYENIIPQTEYDEETNLEDKIVSIVLSQQINLINKSRQDLIDLIQYDQDDESSINYLSRINELYYSIQDLLIRLNKLKESLLVTERHRSKLLKNQNELVDLLSFEQVESLIKSQNLNCLIYFSYVEISSKLNCWFLIPERNVFKFHQISINLFDDLVFLLFNKINTTEDEERNFLLQNIYNLILKPFEKDLLNEICILNEKSNSSAFIRPSVCIVYDENMFKLPFHLLKITSNTSELIQIDDKYLFEVFEINCAYTLKYLNFNYNLIGSNETNIPMKVISNESDMENLFQTNNQYDLLVLLVNSENNDINSLNMLVNTLIARKICKSLILEFNYTSSSNKSSKQELIESEQNAKMFLRQLCSKLSNRSGLKPSLIMNCLMNDLKKSQQQLLNYLFFGNLYPLTMIENELDHADSDLNTVLEEISQNTDQITFSLIIIQYLKLNLKFEAASSILNIIITVISEYLNEKFKSCIKLDDLFQSVSSMQYETSHFVASRLLLKSIGFKFDQNNSGNYVVNLPDKSLVDKINLIHKCLLVLKKFSSEFLVSFYELAVQPAGRELLLLLQNTLSTQPRKEKISLNLNTGTYKQNETFLKEIASLIVSEKDTVRVEIETKTLNNIILLTVIILNNTNSKQKIDETYLHNYIELFFKNSERSELHKLSLEDLEDNSSYSTVSSILGIQSNTKPKLERKLSKQEYEIKIYRELSVPNITTEEIADAKKTATNFKNMIQIEIKNETNKNENTKANSNSSTKYDKCINDLLDFKPSMTASTLSSNCDGYSNRQSNFGFNNMIYQQMDEVKPKSTSLIKLEQKEYLDQITTITTTVKTCTRDDLIMMFDNNLYDNDFYDNDLYSPSMDHINLISPEFKFNATTITPQTLLKPNINKNVYSCLNNYISDYSII